MPTQNQCMLGQSGSHEPRRHGSPLFVCEAHRPVCLIARKQSFRQGAKRNVRSVTALGSLRTACHWLILLSHR
jgi:hypothetical protein